MHYMCQVGKGVGSSLDLEVPSFKDALQTRI